MKKVMLAVVFAVTPMLAHASAPAIKSKNILWGTAAPKSNNILWGTFLNILWGTDYEDYF